MIPPLEILLDETAHAQTDLDSCYAVASPELIHFQTLFYDAIATRQAQSIADLTLQIRSNGSLNFEQGRLAYQGSLIGNLSRALEEIYPVCYQLVGKALFGAMTRRYIRQHPSQSPNLGGLWS